MNDPDYIGVRNIRNLTHRTEREYASLESEESLKLREADLLKCGWFTDCTMCTNELSSNKYDKARYGRWHYVGRTLDETRQLLKLKYLK